MSRIETTADGRQVLIDADPRPPVGTLEIGRGTRRRIGRRILPFLFILYVVNFLDRVNVSYAGLGMAKDLGFSDQVFGFGAGLFFISYFILQIPGAVLAERWSARKYIAVVLIAWGVVTG